ncbi:MAG: trehalose-phosphatase [Hadesarchaea archaeon]|nr:MAG: trehalose-phosphatase [Hadesarchaea archaeon]
MKHLLSQLHKFQKNLRAGAVLLLDYDGTIVPIARRPELALLPDDTRKLLKALIGKFKLVIISGRALSSVKHLVRLRGIYYVGNHGFEINGPNVNIIKSEAKCTRPIISDICEKLREKVGKMKGVVLEDKGLTASVHYRLVERNKVGGFKKIFWSVVNPYVVSGKVRITEGKKVFEIRPNLNWDKGKAALWIMDVIDPKKKLIPVYVGDDQTDEDAFSALRDRGITVVVSARPRRSQAKFFLRDVDEVKAFLSKMAQMRD